MERTRILLVVAIAIMAVITVRVTRAETCPDPQTFFVNETGHVEVPDLSPLMYIRYNIVYDTSTSFYFDQALWSTFYPIGINCIYGGDNGYPSALIQIESINPTPEPMGDNWKITYKSSDGTQKLCDSDNLADCKFLLK